MLLPDTIPCAFGTLTSETTVIPGNGWEVKVRAHTDFNTLVCVVPKYTSLQFAKILKDKGSGTIVLNMDDQTLFPDNTLSLNVNADLSAGLAGWTAEGGTVSLVSPGPPGAPLANSLFLVPDGISQNSYAEQEGDPFPVVSQQQYVVTAEVYSPEGASELILGMVFADIYGHQTPVFSSPQIVAYPLLPLPPGVWATISVQIQAPVGSVTGWAAVGEGNSPTPGDTLYAEGISVTYESLLDSGPEGGVAILPGVATLGDYLLAYEHLWEVYRDGQLLFDFTGQSVTEQQVDPSEQRLATVTGPGTVNLLSWARAMPPGFPSIVFKTDAIQDGFAEVDTSGNPALDTNIWNKSGPLADITLNPLGTCQITASATGTFLGASPYDITSSSISAQITAPFTLNSGATMDSSQLAQFYVQDNTNPGNYALFGLSSSEFYAQVGDTVAATVPTKKLGTYDPNADLYWRISESAGVFTFWTSADGQNWVSAWQQAYKWDATNITVFFSATYDQASTVAIGLTNVNGDIITPSSAGNIFLLTPIMSVWSQLFRTAQQRGTIPWIRTRLNSTTDSFGNSWTDGMSVQIQNGTDLYSLLQTHAGIVNADWVMQPGFRLDVGLPLQSAGQTSLGRDLSTTVIVRESREQTTKQRVRARDQVSNLVGAVNADGTVVSAQDADSIATYSQREGWVETAQAVNPKSMQIVVAATIGQTKQQVLSETMSILPAQPGATPGIDFEVGDWIGRERAGVGSSVVDAIRVLGYAYGIDATGGVTCELTLNTYRQWLQEQLQYLVDKFGGQFINALGTVPVTSVGGTGTTPVTVAPGLGGLSDVSIGTEHMDPLVWNAIAAVWQNASNPVPSGSAIGLAIGAVGGSQAALEPAAGSTVVVDGTLTGTLLAGLTLPSAAGSETQPGSGAVGVIFNAGAASEQLGVLFAAGLSGHPGYALLLTATSADGTAAGHARIGTLTAAGAFTTVQTF